MSKRYVVRLTADERADLQRLVRAGKAAARKILHAHVLLQADEGPDGPGWHDTQISAAFSVHPNTVAGIRERLVEQGLEAALNRKKQDRPSRPPKLDGKGEARLIAERCGPAPQGHKRWTLQLLADRLVALQVVDDISYETVRRTLKKTS
jgi:transposase